MTLVWRICFSAMLAMPALALTVRGSIELVGSSNPMVRRHKDYSGVVVWLEPLGGGSLAAGPFPRKPAQMSQKNKMFIPHVLAIPVGGSVSFPNFDPIFHNAFSNFNGQTFDVGLYKPGSSRTVAFQREGIVRVFCNIHPQMSAVIVVLGTPYFAVTNKAGFYEIDGVPAGEYQLHLFHERADTETLQSLERRVKVENSPVELASLSISENGYLAVPHKNKFGKDYPPVIEDQPAYSGAKR
jgi:plastocyanin